MSQSKISVEHVRTRVAKPFDEFTAAFESQLGHFEKVEKVLAHVGQVVADFTPRIAHRNPGLARLVL